MGVQGLSSLLEKKENIHRDVELKNTRLVVDGSNLLCLMYFKSGLDQNHGGDYAAYEARIERFVTTLRVCRVEPFVLLDGATDPSDKKLETVSETSNTLVKKAHDASQNGTCQNIRPHMAKAVFKQTLTRLKVPLAQCYTKADYEIAALAKEWNVPVLSDDSDFYVFDLPEGFLPFSHFRWEEAARTRGSQKFISCKMYKISNFCTSFRIENKFVATFAALAGNDYGKANFKKLATTWTNCAPNRDRSASTMRLEGLLCWLRRFKTPLEAFEEVMKLCREQKQKVVDDLVRRMKKYQVPPSSLSNFFTDKVAPPFPNAEESQKFPDWIRQPLTEARLPAGILDVLRLRRGGLSIVVEDSSLPSAHQTSRPLRQAMYGLLLGHNATVKETDRVGDELQDIPVQATKHGAAEQLTLLSLQQAEESERLQVLLETLRLDPETWSSVSRLEAQLRLPVAITCYWFQQAQPRPEQEILRALLMLLSLEDGPEPRRALQGRRTQSTPRPDVAVAHALNQWQSCLKDTIRLNQLLGLPLPEPRVARLYEGTLVHQMVRSMRADVYKQMLATITQSAPLQLALPTLPVDDLASSMQQGEGEGTM